jgi:hypothetical protein
MVGLAEWCGWRHEWCLNWTATACARDSRRAVSGKANEAGTNAVGQGFDEVCEAVAHMYIVDDTLAEGRDGLAEEVQADGHIFFSCAKCKRLQQYDSNADNAEEGSDGRVAQVTSRVQTFNNDLEDITGCM